jgi:DNA invertase Pin-like site-specific DNA recombinase
VNALKEFQSLGIDSISYQENIDTTKSLIFHVMASLAQFESSLISQRVQAAMARAKAQGKHIVPLYVYQLITRKNHRITVRGSINE